MARLNNIIKFFMINVNILFSFIGVCFFGFAMYLWCSNWGNLDPGFFIGSGVVIALMGVLLFLLGCIGCMGIDNQNRKFKYGITGRKIIFVHIIVAFIGLIGELSILRNALSASAQYKILSEEIKALPIAAQQPPYAIYEQSLEKQFDRFFFGAASECSKTLYAWFWRWVNNNCPPEINQLNCQKCFDYSITFCEANSNACYATETQEYNLYCPYNICRAGMLNYFDVRIKAFAVIMICLIILQAIFLLCDLMILCFQPRDSLERILYKSGTLTQAQTV